MQGEVGGAPSVTESPSVSADNPSLEEGWAMKKLFVEGHEKMQRKKKHLHQKNLVSKHFRQVIKRKVEASIKLSLRRLWKATTQQ